MTQDDIIQMAREAGLLAEDEAWISPYQEAMERFAALVAAHEREKLAEQEPVAWHHPECDGQCIACLIEKAVQDAYGTQGRDYMLRHINAAPVRTKDLTPHEITALIREGSADGGWQGFAQRVIAADREKNK